MVVVGGGVFQSIGPNWPHFSLSVTRHTVNPTIFLNKSFNQKFPPFLLHTAAFTIVSMLFTVIAHSLQCAFHFLSGSGNFS